jgi:hypothetical protein
MKEPDLKTVYPLADTLQLRLGVHLICGVERIVKLSHAPTSVRVLPEFGMEIKCDFKTSYKSSTKSIVLIRVRKDFYMLMSYDLFDDTIRVDMIDAELFPITPQVLDKIDGKPLKDVLRVLSPAIKATYTKKQYRQDWEKVDVSDLDSGQGTESEPSPGTDISEE